MAGTFRRLLNLRFRISIQMYMAISGAVLLTIAAAIVGWFSFNRVSDAQSRVAEGSIPAMAAAIRIADSASTLAAAAPRLTAAAASEDLAVASEEIDLARTAFQEQISILEVMDTADSPFDRIRTDAQIIFSNLDTIEGDKPTQFALNEQSDALLSELNNLRDQLDGLLVPAIDDQLFYQLTGYLRLGEDPVSREVHFSETQFNFYRNLAALRSDSTLAVQLMSSAFSVSNAAQVEPLRESFESTRSHLEASLGGLGDSALRSEVEPLLNRLFEISASEDSGFSLLAQRLRLEETQLQLLSQNQDLGLSLVAAVNEVVASAQDSADRATLASTQAIRTGRTLLLTISGLGIIGALLISWVIVGRILLRRINRLSGRMRRMAEGDLEEGVTVEGRGELAEMAEALEVFRRHALEVQRLNLVEQLAQELGDKNTQLEDVLEDLQQAQDQIVMREKLAALGEVTAGVAHEIRNPLNFVKNFSEASAELIVELKEVLAEEDTDRAEQQEELLEIAKDLTDNLERIRSHGDRANRIVQDMLRMGRGGGEHQSTDINGLVDQHTLLAYHSARAVDPDFNLTIEKDYDPELGSLDVIPQDLGRVFLNIVGNACQATDERRYKLQEAGETGYMPTVWITTRRARETAEISVRDNGGGIPDEIVDKIFNPFFTTKATDKGTGLGLALSSDIIRQHGGEIKVKTEPGESTEFKVILPLVSTVVAAEEPTWTEDPADNDEEPQETPEPEEE